MRLPLELLGSNALLTRGYLAILFVGHSASRTNLKRDGLSTTSDVLHSISYVGLGGQAKRYENG